MSRFNTYLFDIGNVILGFDFSIAVERLREFGITHHDPLAHISEIKERYEAGEMDDEEFIELAIGELGFSGADTDFIQIWQEIFHENQPMVATIRRLEGEGAKLYLLSNTNGLHLRHILRDYPVFAAFSGGIYSHEAKSSKPETPMYEQAISRFGLRPQETLYIDDLPANIVTGKALGFVTHQYDLNNHAAFLEAIA
jgi:putative hydrolase of the HAD superfamily